MNRLTRGFVLCVFSLLITGNFAFAADPIGKVVAILGAPSASGPDGDRTLSAGDAIFENDKITVGSTGNAQVLLNDGTRLVVGPASSLLLDKFVMQGTSGKADSVGVKALRGTFRFITGKSSKSAYNIATSNATIGIRGTGFDFWVKNNTGVLVMEGSVNLNNNHGKKVLIRADCEMGRSTPNDARRLTGNSFAEAVHSNLPYVLNQKSLKPLFRLPIENCRTLISNSTAPIDGGEDGGQGDSNQNPGGISKSRGGSGGSDGRDSTCDTKC